MQLVLEPTLLGVAYFLKELVTDKGTMARKRKRRNSSDSFLKEKKKRPKKQLRRLSQSSKALQCREDRRNLGKAKKSQSRG